MVVVAAAVLASASAFLGVLGYGAVKEIVTKTVTGKKTQESSKPLTKAGKAAASTFRAF